MRATKKRASIDRYPEEVNMFSLYLHLWDLATTKSGGKGYSKGTECPFTEQEIVDALADQGIQNYDMEKAIKHCCVHMKILEKKADNFHIT